MPRKVFHVGIDFDIHAVSCPGVWLCPRGDAMLKISMLGATAHTKRVEPCFPLLFHESFHFPKTFTGITTLAGLQCELTKRIVQIQLVQWQVHGCRCVLLAAFQCPLSELLYPQPASRGLMAGVDVDLLMESTACFPGIIAPKVEISTKVVIEEMVNYPVPEQDKATINPKVVTSKRTRYRREDKSLLKTKAKSTLSSGLRSRLRQKPVCHARPRVKCYNCKQRVDRAQRVQGPEKEQKCVCAEDPLPTLHKDDTHYLPYCNNCGDVVEEKEVQQGKIILKESSQQTKKYETTCPCLNPPRSKSACDCNLCLRYRSLFKDSNHSSDLSPRSKSPKGRSGSPLPQRKDKLCPCLMDRSDVTSRLRAGSSQNKTGCPCVQYSSLNDSICDNRDSTNNTLLKRNQNDEEYRKLLKADLDTHYKKLYERVSRRSNRRES